MCGLGHPDANLPGNGPARSTNGTNSKDAQGVLEPFARRGGRDVGDGGQGAGAASTAGGRVAPVATWEANVAAVAAAEQRRLDAIGGAGGRLALATRVLHVVVEALRDEDQVGEAKVDCEGDDGGDETGPEGTGEVGDIANEPDDEEGERDAICRARLVVFEQLGDLMGEHVSIHGCMDWVAWAAFYS